MFTDIQKSIAEIQQSRSRFQLERFVLGQHPTQEMQYYQTCLELSSILGEIKRVSLSKRRLVIEIKRLKQTNDELAAIDAEEKEDALNSIEVLLIGLERELNHLTDIWDSFEVKYTREQIEAAQPEYWLLRLSNNARAMMMSGSPVNPAHIEAMEQAGILETFLAQVEEEKIKFESPHLEA